MNLALPAPGMGARALPPLASLRAFEAAARHGSFRAAAEELAITQSAVSHQIAGLERRLGTALIIPSCAMPSTASPRAPGW